VHLLFGSINYHLRKLSSNKDSKITWITCPDCGSKIGIVVSVGKAKPVTITHEEVYQPPQNIRAKLEEVGLDLGLVDLEESETAVTITPKRFLGDQWGPVNDAIKQAGGNWIRDGRNSRWEIYTSEP